MILIKKMHFTKVGKGTSIGFQLSEFKEKQIAELIKNYLMKTYSIVSDIEVK